MILPLSGRRLTCSTDILVDSKMSTSSTMEGLQARLLVAFLAILLNSRPNRFPGFFVGGSESRRISLLLSRAAEAKISFDRPTAPTIEAPW